jgi:hypothetical protein
VATDDRRALFFLANGAWVGVGRILPPTDDGGVECTVVTPQPGRRPVPLLVSMSSVSALQGRQASRVTLDAVAATELHLSGTWVSDIEKLGMIAQNLQAVGHSLQYIKDEIIETAHDIGFPDIKEGGGLDQTTFTFDTGETISRDFTTWTYSPKLPPPAQSHPISSDSPSPVDWAPQDQTQLWNRRYPAAAINQRTEAWLASHVQDTPLPLMAAATEEADRERITAFLADQTANLLVAHDGLIDLAPTTARYQHLTPRIEAARAALHDLIAVCEQGNQQHAALAEYAEEDLVALEGLKPSDPGIPWYVRAQKIEAYRSNYVAQSKQQPGEYPPLDPALSTEIDTVVLTTGILARSFPEIAKSQDDFEKYAGRQLDARRIQRELLDTTLANLAASDGVLTPRAAAVVQEIVALDPGAAAEDASETARIAATKSGFVRSFLAAVAKLVLEQVGKEIIKSIFEQHYPKLLQWLSKMKPDLVSLAAKWRAMYDFVEALYRTILGP